MKPSNIIDPRGWVPIEQPPSHNNPVLVLERGGKVNIAIYIHSSHPLFKEMFRLREWEVDPNCSGHECDPDYINPIYWRELPEQPQIMQ